MKSLWESNANSCPVPVGSKGGHSVERKGFCHRRGHTLLEMMIVCVMFILAGLLVLELFKYGTRTFTTVNTRLDNQRKVLKVLNDINQELEQSTIESVTFSCYAGSYTENSVALCFLTPYDQNGVYQVNSDNTPKYMAWLIYYFDEPTHTIKRIRIEDVHEKPISLLETDVDDHVRNKQAEVVLENVASFKAIKPTGDIQIVDGVEQLVNDKEQMKKADTVFRLELKIQDTDDEKFKNTGYFVKTYRLIK